MKSLRPLSSLQYFAAALFLATASIAFAGDPDLTSKPSWVLVSGVSGGKSTDASDTHAFMSFTATRVYFPGNRKLSFEADTTKTPHQMTIFNVVGDRKFIIYSCLYRVTNGMLDFTFNPGKDMPTSLTSGPKDSSIELHFKGNDK